MAPVAKYGSKRQTRPQHLYVPHPTPPHTHSTLLQEDEAIVALVAKYGSKRWTVVAEHLPGRIGKQCRERWHNHLNPGIKRGEWGREEDETIVRFHRRFGNQARFVWKGEGGEVCVCTNPMCAQPPWFVWEVCVSAMRGRGVGARGG